MSSPCRVLLVDGDAIDADVLAAHVRDLGHEGVLAATAAEAAERMGAEFFDVVLVSLDLGEGRDCETVLEEAARVQSSADRWVLVGGTTGEPVISRFSACADLVLEAPVDPDELATLLDEVVASRSGG